MNERVYIAIDLKAYYASAECVSRGLDPLTTNLVVADTSRSQKTICLAVSPSLKALGIPGRPRLFEVIEQVQEINAQRRLSAPGRELTGASYIAPELEKNPNLALTYLIAPPRMAYYIDCSSSVYEVYLKYVAPGDIHIYSIDEVFMDVTNYLATYKLTPRELAMKMILDVLKTTGITATAGIGTNLYLAKVAMDILAKRIPPDENGVRIAELDEKSYRQTMWTHRPLTDFWRVGRGYAKKLEAQGLFTMGDVARCSIGQPTDYYNEELLYKMFGVNAQLLIDHSWGWEPCTISHIKAYKPETKSIGAGQVLQCAYPFDKARMVAWEMADQLALDLVARGLVTNQLTLNVSYDSDNLRDPERRAKYRGPVTRDHYGRAVPKHAHGTANLEDYTASSKQIGQAITDLFDQVVDPALLVRRMYLTANHVEGEDAIALRPRMEQLDLFTDFSAVQAEQAAREVELAREKRIQKAMLGIRGKFGKNAILKGSNLLDGATTIERNQRIGGHRA